MSGARVYLLAAGHGRRAGGPKAWAMRGEKPLLRLHLEFLAGRFDLSHVFVSVQEAWLARCRELGLPANFVPCDPEGPPMASLQRLLAAGGGAAGFVYHVDMPLWEPEAGPLLKALEEGLGGAAAAVPAFNGRRGHPVYLSAAAAADASRLDPAQDRLDAFLRRCQAAEVPVASPLIHANWNEGRP